MNGDENTKIYLIRHAQSEANETKKYTGWLDVDLSDTGVLQAEKTSGYFTDIKIDSIYASTLKRAYRTAHLIFGNNKEIRKLDEFREIDLGLFEVKTHDELMVEYPRLYSDWITDPTLSTPPDGENIYDYYSRVKAGFYKVLLENKGKTVAIVAHSGVIRCILLYTLNMKLNDIWSIKVDNVSVSCVEFSGGKKALTLLNDTCHLREV